MAHVCSLVCCALHVAVCRISRFVCCLPDGTQIQLYEESGKFVAAESEAAAALVALQITSYGKSWIVRRSYEHFRLLDEQLHRCIYDRKFSQLPLLPDHEPRDAPTPDDGAKQQPPEVNGRRS